MYFFFFWVSLYKDYFSDLHKKFQVTSTDDANVEQKIWSFFYNLFLNYAVNRHTDIHSDICADKQTNRSKYHFLIQGTSKLENTSKAPFPKFDSITKLSLPCEGERK